jgi:hypothetical protein
MVRPGSQTHLAVSFPPILQFLNLIEKKWAQAKAIKRQHKGDIQ